MTARLVRVALFLGFLLAAASPVAAGPELGARLSPTMIVAGQDSALSVTNRSTVPVTYTAEASGEWSVAVTAGRLDVGEAVVIPVTAGPGDTVFRVTLAAESLPAGMDASALVLETRGRHRAPWESLPSQWPLVALAALSVALVGAYAVRRRVRA